MIDEADFTVTFGRPLQANEKRALVEAMDCIDRRRVKGRPQPRGETAASRLERTFGTANDGLSMSPASPDVLWWAMRTVMFAHAGGRANRPRFQKDIDRAGFRVCEKCDRQKGPSAFLKNGDGRLLCRKCRRNER